MNQSSYIAAFLLAGFILWLAANNRLTVYAAVLWGSPVQGAELSGNAPGPTATGSDHHIFMSINGSAPIDFQDDKTATSSPVSSGGNPLDPLLSVGSKLVSSQAAGNVLTFLGSFFGL